MHFHLLMMSIQEEPPGSIPDDMALIRRWLGSPSEDIWRRVRPQVLSAWTLRTDRWFNLGMVQTFERKERFAKRYENGTRLVRENPQKQENSNRSLELDVGSKTSKAKPSIEEVIQYCAARKNSVDPQTWFDHYSANGWKVGRNTMKDWRAAVRTWERKNGSESGKSEQCKRHPDSGLTPRGTCWACYAEKHSDAANTARGIERAG
jgi:hypothetical protein